MPALNSPLRTWVSDEDAAREAAQERLDESLARLRGAGVSARGDIGDGDPLQALEDALRPFPADEIVVSTHPPGRSHWLEQGVVESARMRFDVPVTHADGESRWYEWNVHNLLGDPHMGFIYAMQSLDNGRLGIAACAVGLAQVLFQAGGAVSRSSSSTRFGSPA